MVPGDSAGLDGALEARKERVLGMAEASDLYSKLASR